MSAPPKRYLQLRDNFERYGYAYDGSKTIKAEEFEEIQIRCAKCGNYISLGVDLLDSTSAMMRK